MTTTSVPDGNAVSACQTIDGSRPDVRRSARAMSRSRLMPGKTRTADFMAIPVRLPSAHHFDAVVLDDGIGEELFGGGLQCRFGAGAVRTFDLDIKDLALADTGDRVNAKRPQRAFDGLALRVENSGFQRHGDAGFHEQRLLLAISIWMNRRARNCAGRQFFTSPSTGRGEAFCQ